MIGREEKIFTHLIQAEQMQVLYSNTRHIPFIFNKMLTPEFSDKLMKYGSKMRVDMEGAVVRR